MSIGAGSGTQWTQAISPFGNLPYGLAGRLEGQFARPLGQGLGFNPSQHFMNQLANAQGPLADLIRNVQSMVPGMAGQAQQLGAETAARGSQAYQSLTNQIDQYLSQFNPASQLGMQSAETAVTDAFSPLTSSAMYGQASQRMLDQMRPGEAARGLESSGASQAAESSALRDLSFQFAQNQAAQQQQALQGLSGQMANLGGGVGAANALMQGVGQAQDLQSQQFQLPMQALGNILQLLMGGFAPGSTLLGQTAPQLGSFGHQVNASAGL